MRAVATTRRAVTIAAVSAPFGRDVDQALDQVAYTVGIARARGARLVVFPECALGGYLEERPDGIACPPLLAPDGPELARLARIAGETVVCIGYSEPGPDGPYSSAVCLSGDGVLGRHRKVHLPPGDIGTFQAGDGFTAFDTPVGRLGMLICYDKVFPEAARSLALDGAEIVASLAAWPVSRRRPARRVARDLQSNHFDVLDRARAIDNQVIWVSANQTGVFGALRFVGRSKVVGPDGRVLASTGSGPGVAIATVDLTAVEDSRAWLCHLDDRRPRAYRHERSFAPPMGELALAAATQEG